MERSAWLSSLALVAALTSSCGAGATPTNASDASLDLQPPPDAPPDEPAAEPPPDEPKPMPGPPEGSTQEPDPNAKFRDITPRECRALAGKYGELTKSDETAKLSPKLTDKQRAQAGESIDAAARTLEARWAESCESSLVGKVAEEAAINCAMSAKNVAAFDTCLNGPK